MQLKEVWDKIYNDLSVEFSNVKKDIYKKLNFSTETLPIIYVYPFEEEVERYGINQVVNSISFVITGKCTDFDELETTKNKVVEILLNQPYINDGLIIDFDISDNFFSISAKFKN